ncbi:MAG: outer membrane protein assembly factor BamB [Trinickia sp.]|uniref:outer membrane protein assembly factor BamB n=1 Tax=Trinickia sp. TaxID=2571163 RepID=UPI003F81030F
MNLLKRFAVPVACAMTVLAMAACSSTKDPRREPVPLAQFKPVFTVEKAWSTSVGKAGRYFFSPVVVGSAVYAAGSGGTVAKIDGKTGNKIWSTDVHADLTSGVGSDGTYTAVGSEKGGVDVLDANGKLLWKTTVPGEIVSPPLVGNGYVIVRTIDGEINAFNASTGELRWQYHNRAVPLNLRVAAGMAFAGDAAVLAGFPGGSLSAINLKTGDDYWQAPVSFPKGVTEVERINDVTGAPTLVGAEACAVTFQGRISCFDANSGQPVWEQPFSGVSGLAADRTAVVAPDDWSVLQAFDATTGKPLWKNDTLKNRNLSTPYLLGPDVVVGDYEGYVHFLSRDDGKLLARAKTDGSAITAAPVAVDNTLIVQTHDGHLYGFVSH